MDAEKWGVPFVSKWKEIVKTLAPTVTTALGGPLAGMATRFLTTKLLGEDATEDDLENWFATAKPEDLLQIKTIDADLKKHFASVGVDLEKIAAADRADARAMAVKTSLMPQVVISVVFMGGYFIALSFLYGLLDTPEDKLNAQLLAMASVLLGLFTREIPTIMQFWFGSSAGSKTKDNQSVAVARS